MDGPPPKRPRRSDLDSARDYHNSRDHRDSSHRDHDRNRRYRSRSRECERDRDSRGGGGGGGNSSSYRARDERNYGRSSRDSSGRYEERDRDRGGREAQNGRGANDRSGRGRADGDGRRGRESLEREKDRSRSPQGVWSAAVEKRDGRRAFDDDGVLDIRRTATPPVTFHMSRRGSGDREREGGRHEEMDVDGGVDTGKGDKGGSRSISQSKSGRRARDQKEADDDDLVVEEDESLAAMQAMMGFGGFGTTKQKKVDGNDVYAVRKEKKTEYRQYMNRVGGFNRPLSPTRE